MGFNKLKNGLLLKLMIKNIDIKHIPLIMEYFKRTEIAFDLTEEELKKQIDTYTKNIKYIITQEYDENDTSSGYYSSSRKLISLNKNSMTKGNELEIIDTIFHENNHATQDISDEADGMYQYNESEEEHSEVDTAIDEIFTEMRSLMLFDNVAYNNGSNVYISGDDRGYGSLLFAGSILSATLGMTNKEMIKLSLNGREEFDKVASTKFSSQMDYKMFMASFSYNINTIKNCAFSGDNSEISEADKSNNIAESLEFLKYTSHAAIENRVQREISGLNYEDAKEFIFKTRYEMNKIDVNIGLGIQNNLLKYGRFVNYAKITGPDRSSEFIEGKINLLDQALINGADFNEFNEMKMVEDIADVERMASKFPHFDMDATLDLTDIIAAINKIDEQENNVFWNNDKLIKTVRKNYTRENIFQKIKGVFKKKEEVKTLGPSEEVYAKRSKMLDLSSQVNTAEEIIASQRKREGEMKIKNNMKEKEDHVV